MTKHSGDILRWRKIARHFVRNFSHSYKNKYDTWCNFSLFFCLVFSFFFFSLFRFSSFFIFYFCDSFSGVFVTLLLNSHPHTVFMELQMLLGGVSADNLWNCLICVCKYVYVYQGIYIYFKIQKSVYLSINQSIYLNKWVGVCVCLCVFMFVWVY